MKENKERKIRVSCFTLMEMVITIAIIMILTGVAIPTYSIITTRAKKAKAAAEIQAFETAIETFHLDMGRLPRSLSELVQNPGAGDDWSGPYLKNRSSIPKDPWKGDYVFEFTGGSGSENYKIICYGSDKAPGGKGSAADIDNFPDENE